MSTCQYLYDALADYVEGRLSPIIIHEIDSHLILCKNCIVYIKTYRKTVELLGSAKQVEMPEELKQILMRALQG